jgi:hypothetical protein
MATASLQAIEITGRPASSSRALGGPGMRVPYTGKEMTKVFAVSGFALT